MGPQLAALATLIARRQGAAAAQILLRRGAAWMADPANEQTRGALVEQLRIAAERAGGAAGTMAARIAKEVEKRRVSVSAWERDVMALRYEIADMAQGPVREAALDAYAAQVGAGVHLVRGAARPGQARTDVLRALDAEARMLRTERLGAQERERAMAAVAAARAACAAA